MDKKNTVTIRLTDEQFGWLRALSRRSKRSQSEVVRSLIEHGTVRERITRENLDIIRKLIGESTNLNQLARRANAYGFYRVADECSTAVQQMPDEPMLTVFIVWPMSAVPPFNRFHNS